MMKKLKFLFTICFIAMITTANAQYLTWHYMGHFSLDPVNLSLQRADYVSAALSDSDIPYVAYCNYIGTTHYTYIKKYNEPEWELVGSVLENFYYPSLVMDTLGTPYVLMNDNLNNGKSYVKYYNGSSWSNVGAAILYNADEKSTIAIDASGYLYIAIIDPGNDSKAIVQKFSSSVYGSLTGGTWQTVGTAGFTQSIDNKMTLKVDDSGVSYLSYLTLENGARIAKVMKYNGSSWIALPQTGTPYRKVSLALDTAGIPYIGFSDSTQQGKPTVKKYNGSTWETVGPAGIGPDSVDMVNIGFDNFNKLYIQTESWMDEPTVYNFNTNNNDWEEVGDMILNVGSLSTSLAFDSIGNPYVFNQSSSNGDGYAVVYKVCENPGSGGTVGSDQTIATSTIPAPFTEVTAPTGYSGFLEYKWQKSTSSSTAGFSDIIDSNTPGYAEWNPVSQTTWYKRLVKVGCETNWLESNVVQVSMATFDWQLVDTAGFTQGTTAYNDIAIDDLGTPYVVFKDGNESDKVSVMKYTGGHWAYVGSAGISIDAPNFVGIQIDPSGTPYILHGTSRVYVKKFDAQSGSWVAVGAAEVGFAQEASLAINSSGIPYVAYKDGGTIYVKKYNGSSWETVGTGAIDNSSEKPSLTIDKDDNLWLAYRDNNNGGKICVQENTGSVIWYFKANGIGDGVTDYIRIATDTTGTPYVAFQNSNTKATVMKYSGSGTTWNYVGCNSTFGIAGNTGASYISFKINESNKGFVAYRDAGASNKITVKKLNGSSWQAVGSAGFTAGSAEYVALSIDPFDQPYVFYKDGAEGSRGTVMLYGIEYDNPTDGGTIAAAQTIVTGTVPDSLTSTALPSGTTAALEYKWQISTTDSISGFSDISNSNAAGYQPGIINQTTWFKRLARANIAPGWLDAAESNVIKIDVKIPMKLVFATTAANQQVKIPLKGTVDVVIEWGDGSDNDTITTAGNVSHIYTTAGTDTVRIIGTFTGFGYSSVLPEYQNTIREVIQWGNVGLEDLSYAFYNCGNLTNVPETILPTVTNMDGMFSSAIAFNDNISNWDVSAVTTMASMFNGAVLFMQDLSGWQIGEVTNMDNMFTGITLTTNYYNALLINWAAQSVKNNVLFGGGGSKYHSGDPENARTSLINNHSWIITDGGLQPFFSGGDGSQGNPYKIANLNDLVFLSENNQFWSSHFIQTANIDATDTKNMNIVAGDTLGFSPIGNQTTNFAGVYNGLAHTITGLYINRVTANNIGLFGNAAQNASIDSLYLVGSKIKGNQYVGGLAGWSDASISYCSSTGNIFGNGSYTGGLIGATGANGSTNCCFTKGTVTGTAAVGGLIGQLYSDIANCYSKARVTGSSNIVGGLTNTTSSAVSIANCYSCGTVSGVLLVGAFAGAANNCTISHSHWNSDTLSTGLGVSTNSSLTDVTGLNTVQMKVQSNYSTWDFTNIWTIDPTLNDGYPDLIMPEVQENPLQLVFTTTAASQEVKIPLKGTVDVTVNWGDGSTPESITTAGNIGHVYATAGEHTVSITGTLTGLGYDNLLGYWNYLKKVLSWGDVGLEDLSYAFAYCTLLTEVPNDLPATVTNLSYAFYYATNFNGEIGNWNTSSVTTMEGMFCEATLFNQEIGNWDVSSTQNMSWMFLETDSFNQDIGNWNVSNVTNMAGMFDYAPGFNQDIGSWNTAKVTDMSWMFEAQTAGANAFDQNIGSWDISSVTTMQGMFANLTLSTPNYDSTLMGWAAQNVQPNVTFDGGNSQYTCGIPAIARDTLTEAPNSWTITDGGMAADCPMQLRFENIDCELQLPLRGTLDCTVNWGDGTAPEHFTTSGNKSHTYATAGNYIVTISGNLSQFGSGGPWGGHNYLTEVITFGNIGLTSLFGAFWASTSIVKVPVELPATVTNLSYCFHGAGSGTPQDSIQNLDKWDVSNVTNMEHLFTGKRGINPDLSGWNTGNVTNMMAMFAGCEKFNADISGWDVSRVKNMHSMFQANSIFNQDISGWAVDSVTDMSSMFNVAEAFNQDIGSWDVSSVTDMSGIFQKATSFNKNINGWDVSKVTNMKSMFEEASAFNQNIGDWDVSDVTNMESMFKKAPVFTGDSIGKWAVDSVTTMKDMFNGAAAFNGAIGSWNVDSVTLMDRMFQSATSFNQDIGNWNVSKVERMTDMFNGATSFNQDISNWDVDSVSDMAYMFNGATAFNYSLGDWILNSNYVDVEHMLDNCGMDCESYSSTLKGWAGNPNLPTGPTLVANGLTYGTDAAPYRDTLTINRGWTIQGDIAGTTECMCSDPTDGGTIATAQTICFGTAPDSLTGTTLPTGYLGELEYKWQSSTESDSTGFSDIGSSNAAGYQPGTLTETTWFKRLARVDCIPDWTTAAESNVVEITIEPTPVVGSLAKSPDVTNVCIGDNVSATLTAGSGGNGADELEYRTHDGTNWSSWATYTSGSNISTTGKTEVAVRTWRTATYCDNSDTTAVSWTTSPLPVANAGVNATITEFDTYTLSTASAEHYTSVSWTTAGDGTFSNIKGLNPVYTPGNCDLTGCGTVELCLTAEAETPCTVADEDCMTLRICRCPSVVIVSPTQKEVLYGNPVTVSGTSSDPDDNVSIIEVKLNGGNWQTATGTTNWTIDLDLLPGKNTLEARATDASDLKSGIEEVEVTLSIQVIEIPQGWSYISSYLTPTDPNIVNMWDEIVAANNLSILTGVNGIYAPAPFFINTLQNWDVMKGYKVKMHQSDELVIAGDSLNDKTVDLLPGLHIIPVLTNQTTDLDEVFDTPETDILYMLDIYTNQVYWPGGGINTLTELVPGKGYVANFKNPVTLTYPPLSNFTVDNSQPLPPADGPWPCVRTSNYHLISISAQAVNDLQNADYIGAFDSQGNCVGYAALEKTGKNILLTVYGDEPITPENDGLMEGEMLCFRSFDINENSEKGLIASFNLVFPNTDGLFYANGLSGISGFKESSTGIGENNPATSVEVYPNPAKDVLNITLTGFKTLSGLEKGLTATLLTTEGKVVKTYPITSPITQMDVSGLQTGIYLLKIETTDQIVVKRVVKQ